MHYEDEQMQTHQGSGRSCEMVETREMRDKRGRREGGREGEEEEVMHLSNHSRACYNSQVRGENVHYKKVSTADQGGCSCGRLLLSYLGKLRLAALAHTVKVIHLPQLCQPLLPRVQELKVADEQLRQSVSSRNMKREAKNGT